MTNQETKDRPQETAARSSLTITQLAATALAAVTAAFLGSFVGTAGTVIGAGLASVVTSVSSAIYQRYLDRTRTRVRTTVSQVRRIRPAGQRTGQATEPPTRFTGQLPVPDAPTRRIEPAERPPTRTRRIRWPVVAAVTAVMFLLGVGVVTGVELLKGGPISGGDNGTSVGHLFGQPTDRTTTGDPPTPTTGRAPTSARTPPDTTPPTTTRAPATTTPTPTAGQAPPPATGGGPTTTQPPAPTRQLPSNPSLPAQPG